MRRKVRIGIDVGGTFTDAVAIDNETYEVIAKAKIPTTHHEKEGVAKGIIEVVKKVLSENNIAPEDVVFIAHGTTQATNALLEGDVAKTGIIGMGKGFEGERAKGETKVGSIELAKGKYLKTEHTYLDSSNLTEDNIKKAIKELKEKDVQVIVASEAYSVDNPSNEMKVIEVCEKENIYATGGYEISQLYGLMSRTRTAVVNGALIPKMMETANMTEKSVKSSNIEKPLMIMRCDGGVMTVDEVRKRPILTMLSGLAAGVAGALMYEKVSDGIFFEVGGTSTDISVIKDGKVMIKNAQVGGHKLYLTSLDVRTLGIAGGSMIVVENNEITDVGPRSAHIADKEYEVFVSEDDIVNPKVEFIAPRPEDKKHYVVIESENGKSYSLTLAGAANILGYVPESDYAKGNVETARIAWGALAKYLNISIEEACRQAMDIAIAKVKKIVDELIKEYSLNESIIKLVGGGGSASIITPYLGEKMGIKFDISKNAPYISTIGVALALVREQIERNVSNPTEDDIRKIRSEVMDLVVKAGANSETVEISIEIDSQKNILRAIATGATELRTKDLNEGKKSIEELEDIVKKSTNTDEIQLQGQSGRWNAYMAIQRQKKFFGLISYKKNCIRVIDDEGVIRLQKDNGKILEMRKNDIDGKFIDFIDEMTTFSDAGAVLPKAYLFYGQKQLDLSGMTNKKGLISLVKMELEFVDDNTAIIVVASKDM